MSSAYPSDMRTVVQRWVAEVRARNKASTKRAFSGSDGDDYEEFVHRLRDSAIMTHYEAMLAFLAPAYVPSEHDAVLKSGELARALIGLRSVMEEDSKGAGLILKTERQLQQGGMGFVNSQTGVSAYGVFRGIMGLMQKLSKQDGSLKYWVDLIASIKIKGTGITTNQPAYNRTAENAWHVVIMLDEIYDRVIDLQRQLGEQKGKLKPSTLTPIRYKPDWQKVLDDADCVDSEGAFLTCERDDDPLEVLEAAIYETLHEALLPMEERVAELNAAYQEVIDRYNKRRKKEEARWKKADEEQKAAGVEEEKRPLFEPSDTLQELGFEGTTAKKKYEAAQKQEVPIRTRYDTLLDFRAPLLTQVQEYEKAKVEALQAAALSPGAEYELVRAAKTYRGEVVPPDDLRILPTRPRDQAAVFLKKCPPHWRDKLKALGFPMRSLREVGYAIALYDSLTLDGQPAHGMLGAPGEKDGGQTGAKTGTKTSHTPKPTGAGSKDDGRPAQANQSGPPATGGTPFQRRHTPYQQGRGDGFQQRTDGWTPSRGGYRGGRGGYGGGGRGGQTPRPAGNTPYRSPQVQKPSGLVSQVEARPKEESEANGAPAEPAAATQASTSNTSEAASKAEPVAINNIQTQEKEEGAEGEAPPSDEGGTKKKKKKKKKKPATDYQEQGDEEEATAAAGMASTSHPPSSDTAEGRAKLLAQRQAAKLESRKPANISPGGNTVTEEGKRKALETLEWLRKTGATSGLMSVATRYVNTISAFVLPSQQIGEAEMAKMGMFPAMTREDREGPVYTEYTDSEGKTVLVNSLGDTVYRCKVRLGEGDDAVTFSVLLDSGAGCNLFSKRAYEKIPASARPTLKRSRQTLLSACTTTMASMGTMDLSVAFPNASGTAWSSSVLLQEIEVMNRLNDEVILGVPGLKAGGFVLDFATNSVSRKKDSGDFERVQLLTRSRDRDVRKPVTSTIPSFIPVGSIHESESLVRDLDEDTVREKEGVELNPSKTPPRPCACIHCTEVVPHTSDHPLLCDRCWAAICPECDICARHVPANGCTAPGHVPAQATISPTPTAVSVNAVASSCSGAQGDFSHPTE